MSNHGPQGPDNASNDPHDINWLEYWPESEFRLDQTAPHMDLADLALPVGGVVQQPHNGGVAQHAGHLRDAFGAAAAGGVAQGLADHPAAFKVCIWVSARNSQAPRPSWRAIYQGLVGVLPLQGGDVSFLSTSSMAGAAAVAAVATSMLPRAAATPAALPVDSYASSYATDPAGGLGAQPLMYPSFQLPGAKPEGAPAVGSGGVLGGFCSSRG